MAEQRKPVAAAVRYESGVIRSLPAPNRHHHILHAIHLEDGGGTIISARGEQGFLMSDGTFADRVEAANAALSSGLISKLQHPPRLYTEDLW